LQTSGLIEMRSDMPPYYHNRQRIQEETRWSLASWQASNHVVFNLKMDIFLDDMRSQGPRGPTAIACPIGNTKRIFEACRLSKNLCA